MFLYRLTDLGCVGNLAPEKYVIYAFKLYSYKNTPVSMKQIALYVKIPHYYLS